MDTEKILTSHVRMKMVLLSLVLTIILTTSNVIGVFLWPIRLENRLVNVEQQNIHEEDISRDVGNRLRTLEDANLKQNGKLDIMLNAQKNNTESLRQIAVKLGLLYQRNEP